MKNSTLFAAPLALALSLGLAACGAGAGGGTGVSAAGTGAKDPVAQGRLTIWEQEDKDLSKVMYQSETEDVSIDIDVENGIVTDVMLECTGAQMSARLEEWTAAYDGLGFAVVYDDMADENAPSVRVCFYGLEDAARAQAFVDAYGGDIFTLNDEGLIEEQTTVDGLVAAGYKSMATDLQEELAELEELSDQLDAIAAE